MNPTPVPVGAPPFRMSLPSGPVRAEDLTTRGARPVVFRLRPPYREPEWCGGPDAVRAASLEPGGVLGIGVPSPPPSVGSVLEVVGYLRARFPTVPVVLWIPEEAGELSFVAAIVARVPIRAVLVGPRVAETELRRMLSMPARLPSDVVDWLPLAGISLNPTVSHLIAQIVGGAGSFDEVGQLLKSVGIPSSSARFRFRKKRLPPPSRWFHMAKALSSALRIQADPERSLLSIALELGYADHSSLSHQLRRLFGVSPKEIRPTVGWEWLLARWLCRELENPPRILRVADPVTVTGH